MNRCIWSVAAAAMAGLAVCGGAVAQDGRLLSDRTPAERPQLMVVGVAHFDNPGRDVVNSHVEDLLTPARQKEMAATATP